MPASKAPLAVPLYEHALGVLLAGLLEAVYNGHALDFEDINKLLLKAGLHVLKPVTVDEAEHIEGASEGAKFYFLTPDASSLLLKSLQPEEP